MNFPTYHTQSFWHQIFSLLLSILLGMICLMAVYTVTASALVPVQLKWLLSLIVVVLGLLTVTMKFSLTRTHGIRIGVTILMCVVTLGIAFSSMALSRYETDASIQSTPVSTQPADSSSVTSPVPASSVQPASSDAFDQSGVSV